MQKILCGFIVLSLACGLSAVALAAPLGGLGESSEPILTYQDMTEKMVSLTDWSVDVVRLLSQRLALLPTGFWISGATFGEHLYGVAFWDHPQTVDVQMELGIQSTKAAFYDQTEFPPLSPRSDYEIKSFAEVIVTTEPQGCLVKIALEQVERMDIEEETL